MIYKLKTVTVLTLLFAINICNAQIEKSSDLFTTLKEKDSLLFEVGFNQCNLKQMKKMVVDDIEFYHDRDGITKQEYILLIQ